MEVYNRYSKDRIYIIYTYSIATILSLTYITTMASFTDITLMPTPPTSPQSLPIWSSATAENMQRLAISLPSMMHLEENVKLVSCTATGRGIRVQLKNTQQHTKSSFELVTKDTNLDEASGLKTLGTMTALTQIVLTDPLLCQGVRSHGVSVGNDGELKEAYVDFHGHKIDVLDGRFFQDGAFQGHSVIAEIIRTVKDSSGVQAICHISFAPIEGPIAFLPQETTPEGVKRTYAEDNIRRWVRERGTAPFTREQVCEDDIMIDSVAAVPLHKQPRLMTNKRTMDTSLSNPPETKKSKDSPTMIHLTIVGDRSGSMINMKQAAFRGIQEILKTNQDAFEKEHIPTSVTFTSFDNSVEDHMIDKPIESLKLPLSDEVMDAMMYPRGGTALYDAIHHAASILFDKVQDGEKGIFAVITDGHDTSSKKNNQDVQTLLEQIQDEKNIECIFMGANIGDATEVGTSMGFRAETSLTFSSETAATAFSCMNQSMLRSATGGSAAFTHLERQTSAPSTHTKFAMLTQMPKTRRFASRR